MTAPAELRIVDADLDAIAKTEGRVAVFIEGDGRLDQPGRRVNRLTRGALERFAGSEAFEKMKPGEAALLVVSCGPRRRGRDRGQARPPRRA
jgi:leucyl aminopeptidase